MDNVPVVISVIYSESSVVVLSLSWGGASYNVRRIGFSTTVWSVDKDDATDEYGYIIVFVVTA